MSNLCNNCGNAKDALFLHSNHEIICKVCGLILEESMIDYTPDWSSYDQDSVYDINARCGPPVKEELKKRDVHSIFRDIEPVFPSINATTWDTAKTMYDKMDHVNGDNKRTCALACLYIAQMQVNIGVMSKCELCTSACVGRTEFSHALTALKYMLFRDPLMSHFLVKQSKVEDALHRMLHSLVEIDEKHFQKIRSIVSKLHQKIETNAEVIATPTEKVTASLIYVACKSLDIKLKMKKFCAALECSCSTVFRIERTVRAAILGK